MAKNSRGYGWDDEPMERPSEFMASKGYSVLTSDEELDAQHLARRAPEHTGNVGLLVFLVLLFAVGVYALVEWVPRLVRH